MRKAIDGLSALVREALGEDPLSGHLFVFANRRRDRLKILVWDRDGYWVLFKRLEAGTFRWPKETEKATVVLPSRELMLILEGGPSARDLPQALRAARRRGASWSGALRQTGAA
ncbi:MAG: IS66 family insertion sequence element accessory protein TnpB [Holophagales bacterium]|nr:IS66 family insertion sequence element accessory protein TnpB [Holophagales bacterium]